MEKMERTMEKRFVCFVCDSTIMQKSTGKPTPCTCGITNSWLCLSDAKDVATYRRLVEWEIQSGVMRQG